MKSIPLTQGEIALVDDEDFEEINKFKWYFHHTGYAVRNLTLDNKKRKTIFLHRQIIPILNGQYIDHKDLNKLNNQKNNLRITDYSHNNANKKLQSNNTSKFKGVHKRKENGRFRAYINIKGKRINIGTFDNPIEAAEAYNLKAKELFGEFARLNDVDNASKNSVR